MREFLTDPEDERLKFSNAHTKANKLENLKELARKIFSDCDGNNHGYKEDVKNYFDVQEEYMEILKNEVDEKKQKKTDLM